MITGLSPLAAWVLVGTLAAVTVITTVPAAAGAGTLVLFILAKVAVPAAGK